MKRVLVTGATGFIGRHLVERLVAQGTEVRCLLHVDEGPQALAGLDVACIRGDITRPHTIAGISVGMDVVYHLAGLTLARRSADFYRVNTDGTRHLAEHCASQTTPPVFVFISSLGPAGGGTLTAGPPARRDRAGAAGVALWAEQARGRGGPEVARGPAPDHRGPSPGCLRTPRGLHARPLSFDSLRGFDQPWAGAGAAVFDRRSRPGRGPASSGRCARPALAPEAAGTGSAKPGIYFIAFPEPVTFVVLSRSIPRALGEGGCGRSGFPWRWDLPWRGSSSWRPGYAAAPTC